MQLGNRDDLISRSAASVNAMYDRVAALPSLPFDELAPGRTVGILMDLNRGFCEAGALASDRYGGVVEGAALLYRKLGEKGVPIIAYSDCHPENSPEFNAFPPHCIAGTAESELMPALADLPGLLFHGKNSTNALHAFDPAAAFPGRDIFLLAGVCTDLCIFQFACALKTSFNERNLPCRVVVPLDLIETFDMPGHSADVTNLIFANAMLDAGIEAVSEVRL